MSGIQPVFGQKRYEPSSSSEEEGRIPAPFYPSNPAKREQFAQSMDLGSSTGGFVVTIVLIFLLLWIIFGVIAMILSLVCFGSSGTILEKVLGLIIAWLFGPFFFIYYSVNGTYCQ